VRAVGLGPLAGVLAIATADIAVLAKLYRRGDRECREEAGRGHRGLGRLLADGDALSGVLPQVAPIMLGHVLYFFESNTRSATILGVVGAGGIGLQIAERIKRAATGTRWPSSSS
jgi:phosphonate transport system permease protein